MKEAKGTVALIGNPNVGKSTVFNALTGMNQHTGNWTGKTVKLAKGEMKTENGKYTIIDLPGTYSLMANSPEETVSRDYISSGEAEKIIMVCDGGALERSLNLLLQVLEYNKNVLLCVNLLDEAEKKGIEVDLKMLSELLGVAVVGTSARRGQGIINIKEGIEKITPATYTVDYSGCKDREDRVKLTLSHSEKIAKAVTKRKKRAKGSSALDKIFMGKLLAFPAMAMFLCLLLFITVSLANYPSQALSSLFLHLEGWLYGEMTDLMLPQWLCNLLCFGIVRVTGWIVAVMLPPMAIFFPLFTLLEDWGYLPRIAFNLDKPFAKCGTCGKQALTMCMGIGCNAVGVTGCRIIGCERERKIAMLTNSFVPCNGKLSSLIMLIALFLSGGSSILGSLILSALIVGSVLLTFGVTFLMSRMMKGKTSTFVLELPSYRTPQIAKTLVRSVLDRTLYVLARAVSVALPAGLVIWGISNIFIGDVSLLGYVANGLEPIGNILGVDGVILTAFILGLPANEIIIPIMLMAYTKGDALTSLSLTDAGRVLAENGWSAVTALCTIILMLFHSPCLTTIITIKKETSSTKQALLSALIPTLTGVVICLLINAIYTIVS